MATTEADICNRALLRIGQKETILALTDSSFTAQACNIVYAQARDELLESFPWPWAQRHSVLGLLSVVRDGWGYAYALPVDCISPKYIFSGVRPGGGLAGNRFNGCDVGLSGRMPATPFTVEAGDSASNGVLLTDMSAAELVYIARIEAVGNYPPLFADALAWRVAIDLALAIPVKAALADYATKKYELAFARAGAAAFRGQKEDAQPDSEFISVRG